MVHAARSTSRRWWRRALADRTPTNAEPTVPPPGQHSLAGALSRNIEALARRRAEDEKALSGSVRLARTIGRVIGQMGFVYANIVFYGVWIAASQGLIPGVPEFDHPLYLIGSVASVESIFLSIFILIAQNGQTSAADRRGDLSLQVGLLAEHELTQLIKVTLAIATKLGIDPDQHGEISDLQNDVAPEAVLDKIEREEPGRP